ncbi:MAG: filamentous hemagglutinin family outer membrane protein [Proteobacteria bacterium]|nr:filamentous hemagglutinin family outer membrane protein [Pseudomonadota bacterium]
MFIGGAPGMAQWRAIQMQRHQSRTLLYQQALEELRKNPKAADMPDCAKASNDKACVPAAISTPSETAVSAGKKLALLIGNNEYVQPIPPLETPIHDINKIAELLKQRFGYEVKTVSNAGKVAIANALNQLAKEVRSTDSVLVLYAGHGYLMEDTNMGFWIPVDASVKTAANWISNTDIARFLQAIPARQMILISDSCFSGTLTREQQLKSGGKLSRDEILKRRSVLVMSSGGDEPVSDEGKDGHSIFAWSLINALKKVEGDAVGYDLFRTVRDQVKAEYPQEPAYGAVLSAGHKEGGDYLLEAAGQ